MRNAWRAVKGGFCKWFETSRRSLLLRVRFHFRAQNWPPPWWTLPSVAHSPGAPFAHVVLLMYDLENEKTSRQYLSLPRRGSTISNPKQLYPLISRES